MGRNAADFEEVRSATVKGLLMKRSLSKTTVKTTAVEQVPQPHGGALNVGGTPGNKGGSGRPPNWLRDKCDELLCAPECVAQVTAILENKDHPAFPTMWKALADRAYGKPTERIETEPRQTDAEPQCFIIGGQRILFG